MSDKTCPDCGTRMGNRHRRSEYAKDGGLEFPHTEARCLARQVARLTRERDEARAACAAIMEDVPRLLEALEHDKPGDCYATGPFHGDIRDQMCVACDAQMILNNWMKSIPGQAAREAAGKEAE